MRYRRVLVLAELGADPAPALAAARALAPAMERVVVLASPPPRPFAWPWEADGRGRDPAEGPWLDRLRDAAARLAPRAEVGTVPDLEAAGLDEVAAGAGIDLAVAGPLPLSALAALAELRGRGPVAVLWVPPQATPPTAPPAQLFCVALGARAEASLAAFLRDHGGPGLHARVLSLARPAPGDLGAALAVSGVRASVELVGRELPPWRLLEALERERAPDLVVLARFPGLLLRGARGPAPILVLPPPATGRPALRRPLDVPDLLDDGGPLRVRVGLAYGIGRNPPVEDQELAFVAGGRVVAVAATRGGEAELPAGLEADTLGVFRTRDRSAEDPVEAVERRVAIVRPGPLPLLPFDAELAEDELARIAGARGVEPLAVRLRPSRSCHLVRERLREAELAPRVVDASAVLDEGEAADVSEANDPVRLARVATRLRRAGFKVAAVVHRGPHAPEARGFAALRAQELEGRAWARPAPEARPGSLAARLDAAPGAPPVPGNRVELELDNATARRWLLGAIDGTRERLHLQTYMATDDGVGRQVEAALARAAERGVAVRVLADSLRGLHGSFGLVNPLLARLAAIPGVELRVARPVEGVPSLEDLKRRDHRKVAVADGRVALLGGRNLAREYYTGFDEVEVVPETDWREVPWLDSGARLEGPAVAAVERSFLEAWTGAGGAPFPVAEPPPAGPTPARVVAHRGLRDARTLEAYLALVDTARSHLWAVNGFPLLLELQHALARAVRRGVRVRLLFGPVVPTHAGGPFEGEGTAARAAMTWLVHSRIDALVAAGGEAWQVALRDLPGWAPGLGLVHPHVHAKALSADGRACAVGSANLDVTSSYWEDELLLVLEDEAVARGLEARLERLAAGSVRVDRDDPEWRRLARRREWMRRWPGVLSL